MGSPTGSTLAEHELRALRPSLPAGALASLLVVAAAVPYLAATWDEEHRAALTALLGAAAAVSLAILALPRERILRSRHRNAFLLGWTCVATATIAAAAVLDGGITSPFIVPLFLTQAFSGLFYPVPFTVASAAINLVALGLISALSPEAEIPETLFVGACLVATSAMCIMQARTVTAQRRDLARASVSDPLTACLNRRGFGDRLDHEIARARRSGDPFSLFVLDVDRLKAINDRDGHAAGDAVLRGVAAELEGVMRSIDAVGRVGGDEFAALCPGADSPHAASLLGRMKAALARQARCSIGVVTYPRDGRDIETLLRRADERMYADKREHAGPQATLAVEGDPAGSP